MNEKPVIIYNNIDKFLHEIDGYSCINIFVDDTVEEKIINYYEEQLFKVAKVIKTVFPCCLATEKLANKIEYRKEDLVVCIGGLHLQSLVKYYAYQYNLDYSLIPVHEIGEYSFSKFAFVKDDIFCFYECYSPKNVYISERNFVKEDIYKLKSVLTYKNIVLWEKEFVHDIINENVSDYTWLAKIINLSKDNIYSLSKIFAISAGKLEHSSTYDFFGEDYKMLSLLALNKKSITDNLIAIQNTLVKFYECFLNYDIIELEINLNIYFQKLKSIYNLNVLNYMNLALQNKTNNKEIKYRLNSYLPYLKDMFSGVVGNFKVSKTNFENHQLENALVLCSSVNFRPGIIMIAKNLGYFENLVKDLIA